MLSPDERSSADSRQAWNFYYDGDCGLCRWVVKWLRRMDFGGVMTWTSFQSLDEPPHNLSWEELDRAAYLDAGKGGLHEGFYAFRKLTLKLPSLWPLVPIFWLPGIQIPGRVVYRWVAVNRYRLSRCGLPDRDREPDVTATVMPKDDC